MRRRRRTSWRRASASASRARGRRRRARASPARTRARRPLAASGLARGARVHRPARVLDAESARADSRLGDSRLSVGTLDLRRARGPQAHERRVAHLAQKRQGLFRAAPRGTPRPPRTTTPRRRARRRRVRARAEHVAGGVRVRGRPPDAPISARSPSRRNESNAATPSARHVHRDAPRAAARARAARRATRRARRTSAAKQFAAAAARARP